MFYTIQHTTKDIVEGGNIQRPPWLDVSVHSFNTIVAWGDLLSSNRRTFSRASEQMSSVLVFIYLCYIMLCRHMNGRFPYPFLNKLPFPSGFMAMTSAGLTLFVLTFRLGKALNRQLRKVNVEIVCTDTDNFSIVRAKTVTREKVF